MKTMLLGPYSSFSLVIVLFFTHMTHAAFNGISGACWQRNCIFRNDAGTICMQADYNGIPLSKCTDPVFQNLIQVHHDAKLGRSIAYYDQNGHVLGGAMWPVPTPLTFPVFVCATGQRLDDPSIDRTICRAALRDDDMDEHAAHVQECIAEQPSKPRADPCYRTTNVASAGNTKAFYEQPVAAGIFWILSGLDMLNKLCAAVAGWYTAFLRPVRNRRPGRAGGRLPPAANGRNNPLFGLNRGVVAIA